MNNRLKELRRDKGLTQAELAKVLNTNQSQFGKYENGKTNLSLENAKILADYFGVSTSYLLGLDDKIPSKEGNLTNLQSLVKDSKLSLKEISEITGIGYSTLGNYNQGSRTPNAKNAQILADYFGVSIPYLLGLDDEGCTCNKVMRMKQVDQIKEHLAVIYERLSLINQLLDEE